MSTVTDYLRRMEEDITAPDMWTKEQAEAWANEYWQIRWDKSLNEDEMKAKLAAHYELSKPVRDVHVNQQGNTVVHRHRSADRYLFDGDDDFRGPVGCNSIRTRTPGTTACGSTPNAAHAVLCGGRRVSRDLPRRRTL